MIKLGLLGNNISKSEMPNLITKLGNEFGFDVKYELFDQASKTNFNFKKFLSQIKEKNISGINVTYPFKELALEHSIKLSEETKLVHIMFRTADDWPKEALYQVTNLPIKDWKLPVHEGWPNDAVTPNSLVSQINKIQGQ